MRQQHARGLREPELPPHLLVEHDVQLGLQRFKLLVDGRRAEAQRLRRPRDGAQVGEGDEAAELDEVHRPLSIDEGRFSIGCRWEGAARRQRLTNGERRFKTIQLT